MGRTSPVVAQFEFAARVRKRREELGLPAAAAGKHLGFTRNFYGAVENHRGLFATAKLPLLIKVLQFDDTDRGFAPDAPEVILEFESADLSSLPYREAATPLVVTGESQLVEQLQCNLDQAAGAGFLPRLIRVLSPAREAESVVGWPALRIFRRVSDFVRASRAYADTLAGDQGPRSSESAVEPVGPQLGRHPEGACSGKIQSVGWGLAASASAPAPGASGDRCRIRWRLGRRVLAGQGGSWQSGACGAVCPGSDGPHGTSGVHLGLSQACQEFPLKP